MSTISLVGLDSSVLLNYYSAQVTTAVTSALSTTASASSKSATSADNPPWSTYHQPAQEILDSRVLGLTSFLDLSKVPASAGSTDASRIEQDNQKLFALYNGVNNLAYLAKMSQRDGMTTGQLAGYDTRFQSGLAEIQNFIATQSFNNFTLQTGKTSSSVAGTVSVPFAPFNYQGGTVVADANIGNALGGVSSSDSFNIAVSKGGVNTNVAINLANVTGALTIDNIVSYVNQQLSAAGFSSRFSRVFTQGSINDPTKASYGISISQAPSEALTLSSAGATPALYFAGNSGSALSTSTVSGSTTVTAAADQQGRLVKLTNFSGGTPATDFNATLNPTTGNTTTSDTVVDGNGNVYTVGTATGDFGNQLNQGTQDVVLSKYDSAGNLQWTKLLGSAGSAASYSLALDPTGGLVVAGSTTANLSTAGISNGNADSFVAKYDVDGNQTWVKQIPTLATNAAQSVSVDSSGNIVIGGQVSGVIGTGQTNAGGTDGYFAKLDSKGTIVYEQQLGTAGSDKVAATAIAADGSLYVASEQNGHAILSKYANGTTAGAAIWSVDMGALQNGGSIGGLAVSGSRVYLSGTSSNGALTSSGAASVVAGASGGLDAFVAGFTDSGTAVTADTVTYIGTGSTDTAGKLTVDASGTVYLAGTTTGTFAGEIRNAAGTQNAFVAALSAAGTVSWTHQYGGASGTSTGAGIAIDATGSSVLDALGLPRGTIDINQSVDLAAATTLRPGDSFQIKLDTSASSRTATITIASGETLQSLADKINNAMIFAGKASVTYANGGHTLKIEVNKGVSATLIAGPHDLDALGRLGIAAGTISNGAVTSSSNSSSKQVFGLGFSGIKLSIASRTAAGGARAELLNVLSSIRDAYRTSNAPPSTGSGTNTQSSGPVPAYLTKQLASYQLALNWLSSSQTTQQSTTAGGASLLGFG